MDEQLEGHALDSQPQVQSAYPQFAPIRPSKLALLSVLTLGLYEVVWLYRNWAYLKRSGDRLIWPWARALFAPFWIYSLASRVGVNNAGLLTVGYWLTIVAATLESSYWLLSLFSFLPLLPIALAINRINEGADTVHPSASWRKRSMVVASIGLVVLPVVILGEFGPPGAVQRGEELTNRQLEFLVESGILLEDEEPLLFFSAGFLSIRGSGVVASNMGVTSYWTDPVTEKVDVAYLPYAQIDSVETNLSAHLLEDTVVRLISGDGSWFTFYLSPDGGGDHDFLDLVERQRTLTRRRDSSV